MVTLIESAWAPRGRAVVDDADLAREDHCERCAPKVGTVSADSREVCIGLARLDAAAAPAPDEGRTCCGCGAVLVAPMCTGADGRRDGCGFREDACQCEDLAALAASVRYCREESAGYVA